jgi:hypothetical protein
MLGSSLSVRSIGALRRLCRARSGNIALVAALSAPAIVTLALGATDFAAVMGDKQRMLSIAESAAIAGARNLAVAMTEADALAHARAMAEGIISEWESAPDLEIGAAMVDLPDHSKGVRVTLAAHRPSFFNDLLPPGGWRYDARATASSVGSAPLCMLVTQSKNSQDFLVEDSASVSAPGCLVHSNGNIVVSGGGIEAARTQAVLNATGNISPDPVTDAPTIRDPFGSLAINASILKCGALDTLKKSASLVAMTTGVHVLPPGDHCGTIDLSGDARLILAPGEHRFGGGWLWVRENARLTGTDVVMIVDKMWRTWFEDNAMVALSGRQEGLLAGFVMIADRDNTQPFKISASNVDKLEGVLYVPNAELQISSQGDVASDSEWTVIVAKSVNLSGNPNLVMNVNYGGSDVEVPAGVGPAGGAVRLIE